MKRIHIGLEVKDLDASARFYTSLFGADPVVREADYAKWLLDDPRLNFSISARAGSEPGDVHFGIQVESEAELGEVSARLARAGEALIEEPEAVCCYHKSSKAWVVDPDALAWETFHTHGTTTVYGESSAKVAAAREAKRCCD
ncbi:MAG: ArsI/CadI family heavy metal resistance metalloenzyme [Gammaproteobacteria bacterium]|nr:ArsI/CadI family heavy metal resistance metalloenzyme [Gammaproteobacteria bacterium]